MDAITQWFKGSKDYYSGVAIYASLPTKKLRILKALNRGKSRRNMAMLVSELRQFKNQPTVTKQPVKVAAPPTPTKPVTQEVINTEVQRNQLKTESANNEFIGVRVGDLPKELRPRYSKARTIFYEMIELKFQLNDLAPKQEDEALDLILKIDALEDERDLIWKEIKHWQQFKTLLPTKTDDFSDKSKYELDKIRRNTLSNISKMKKRVDAWYNSLAEETDKHKQRLIENKINKAERELHQKSINIKQIETLLQ